VLSVDALHGELAGRRAYLTVCQGYLKNVIDPDFAQALQQYAELEQDIIHLLARALRLAGESPAETAPDPEPLARGMGLETVADRQGFLLAATRQALARWKEREAGASEPSESRALDGGEQAFWCALRASAEEQIKILTTFQ
jgi:cation transport ATPase